MSKFRDALTWAAVGGAVVFMLTRAGTGGPHGGTPEAAAFAASAGVVSARAALGPCVGDLNNDNTVNTADLVIFLGAFGTQCANDSDGDGVPDVRDNCVFICNVNQADDDGDGVGDRCDNCPHVPNPDQADANSDGQGDACLGVPGNDDGDNVPDVVDTCPYLFDPDQLDSDNDGIGNACDNCPFHFNPGQQDADHDGRGDACEGTLDNDGDGITLEQGDCDDNDPTRYPGAPDPCGDGIDQNCDGYDG